MSRRPSHMPPGKGRNDLRHPSGHTLFAVSDELSESEKRYFQVAQSMALKHVAEVRTQLENEAGYLPMAQRERTLTEIMPHQLYKAVREAGRCAYETELMTRARREEALGNLTRKDVMALRELFAVKPLDFSDLVIRPANPSITYGFSDLEEKERHKESNSCELLAWRETTKLFLSNPARRLAAQTLDDMRESIELYDRFLASVGDDRAQESLRRRLKLPGQANIQAARLLVNGWAANQFTHATQSLQNDAEREQVSKILTSGLARLIEGTTEQPISLAQGAVHRLMERLAPYDARLHREAAVKQRIVEKKAKAEAEPRSEEEIARQKAADAETRRIAAAEAEMRMARDRAERQRQRHEAFMASEQPYQLGAEAGKMLQRLDELAGGVGVKAGQARALVASIQETQSLLDRRDPNVSELGEMLLSAPALRMAARLFKLEATLATIPEQPNLPRKERVERLRVIQRATQNGRDVVETMLGNDMGVLLLALHTQPEGRCAEYAMLLAETTRQLRDVDTLAAPLQATMGDLTREELKELAGEPQVERYLAYEDKKAALLGKLAEARGALAGEVRQVLGGMPFKRVHEGYKGGGDLLPAETSLPSGWAEMIPEEFHAAPSEQGDKYLAIASNRFPEESIDLKRSASPESVRDALAKLNAQCMQHEANLSIVDYLCSKNGFTYSARDASVKHKEYGIEVALSGDEFEQTKRLRRAEDEFAKRLFLQGSLVRSAELAGLSAQGVQADAEREGSALTFSHPETGRMLLAPRGYMSADDISAVEGAMMALQQKLAPEAERSTEAPAAPQGRRTWRPDGKEVFVVLDSNVLTSLAVPRGREGHSWLDLVTATSRLPGVRVIIPEVGALLEAQGLMPKKGKEGTGAAPGEVDPAFRAQGHYLHHYAERVAKLLETVSWGKAGKNGTVELTPGANGKIIVLAAPGDEELYQRIHDLVLSAPTRQHQALLHEHIYDRDEGEKAINRIIEALPQAAYIIVSKDMRYLRKQAPRVTSEGRGVAQASLAAYLDAELATSHERVLELQRQLRDPLPLTVERVHGDIQRESIALKKGYDDAMDIFHSKSAQDPQMEHPHGIFETVAHATRRAQEGANGNGHGNGSGHANGNGHGNGAGEAAGWAGQAGRKTLAPDDIAARRDAARGPEERSR